MKTNVFKMLALLAISAMIGLSSCSGESDKGDGNNVDGGNPASEAPSDNAENQPSESTSSIGPIVDGYLALKDKLVETDGSAAKASAEKLVAAIGETGGDLMSKIKTDAENIAGTEETEPQREYFNSLSDNMLALVKAENYGQGELFLQFCPMAFDNTGAYWISNSTEIMNPYFGDVMLHCGKVEEEL